MKTKTESVLFYPMKNGSFSALVAAGIQSFFFWCPDHSHCSNLPSSAAPLHRAGPHNAQMVAIVLPRPLPHSVEQEALLCMPEGQEAWLTNAEPSEKHTNAHKDTFMYIHLSHTKAKNFLMLISSHFLNPSQCFVCSSKHTLFIPTYASYFQSLQSLSS